MWGAVFRPRLPRVDGAILAGPKDPALRLIRLDAIRTIYVSQFDTIHGQRISLALLSARAAAAKLGVGYSTLKRWVRSGRVRTTRTEGGHHRVADSEIDRLLARHQPVNQKRKAITEDHESLGALSARNRLSGYIEEVRIDGLLAQVQLRVGDQRLTAVITADAVRGLKLRRGDDAIAIVKSTEVMIALPAMRGRATKGK